MEIAVSAITLAELAAGPHATADPTERARRQDRLQRAEATFEPIPFDASTARAYGRVYAAIVSAGRKARGRRAVDLLIAATAVAAELPYTRETQPTSPGSRPCSKSWRWRRSDSRLGSRWPGSDAPASRSNASPDIQAASALGASRPTSIAPATWAPHLADAPRVIERAAPAAEGGSNSLRGGTVSKSGARSDHACRMASLYGCPSLVQNSLRGRRVNSLVCLDSFPSHPSRAR